MKTRTTSLFCAILFLLNININAGEWYQVYEFENEILIRELLPVTSELIFAIGTDGTLAKSTDAGESWKEIEGFAVPEFTFELEDIDFVNETTGYLFGTKSDIPYTEFTDHIFKTEDGGESWTEITTGNDFNNSTFNLMSIDAVSENVIYAGGGEEYHPDSAYTSLLLKSENGGETWTKVEVPEGLSIHGTRFRDENNGNIQVISDFYSTNDGGATWQPVVNPLESYDQFGFRFAGENLFISGGYGIDFASYISTNGGENWNEVTPHFYTWNPAWLDENIGWAWNNLEMIKTNDGGQNWEISADRESINDDIGFELPSWNCFSFSSNSTGYIAAGNYLLKTTNNDVPTNVETEFENVPTEYILSQNYPNPFNPSTTISYSIPKQTKVSLKVYDMLGSEIAELINEEKAAGSYEVDFNAENLSSGIYFYTLRTNEFFSTRKMLLIK